MSYFQQNLTVMQKKFPHVATKMSNINQNEDQFITYLEPLEKDMLWLEAVKGSVEDRNIIFLYGFGQGIGLADLIDMYSDRLFFVYEPNEESFRKSMEELDLRPLLKHPNLTFLSVGISQLRVLFYSLCTHMREEMAFVALRYYLERDVDSLRDLRRDFEIYSETFDSNRRTENLFRKDWVRNSMYQIAGMLSSPSIKELYKTFENQTAVIIASGPSLQKDIEWVKKLKPNALIISAGSSIQALIKHGIQPHLTTLLDGGSINNKVFADPATLTAPFFHLSSSYYEIADKKLDNKIHAVIHNDEVSQYYLGIDKSEAEIMPTPTVVGTAIQAAVWLGAKRIILMGQDLSFPEEKYYADGVEHVDLSSINKRVDNSQLTIVNVQGKYNTTNTTFLKMKDSLESLVASLPEVEFINSTRNGAVIEGAYFKPIEEVYELLLDNSVPLNAVQDLLDQKRFQPNIKAIQITRSKVSTTLHDLTWIIQEFRKLKKLLGKLRELSRTNPAKCQRTFEEIENMWAAIVNRPWFNTVIETILPIEIAEYDSALPSIVLEKNLVKKSNLVNDIVGGLIKNIENEIPFLDEIFSEAMMRLDSLSTSV